MNLKAIWRAAMCDIGFHQWQYTNLNPTWPTPPRRACNCCPRVEVQAGGPGSELWLEETPSKEYE